MKSIISSKTGRIVLTVVAAVSLLVGPAVAQASDDLRAEIEAIKKQLADMDTLKAKIFECYTREVALALKDLTGRDPAVIEAKFNDVLSKKYTKFIAVEEPATDPASVPAVGPAVAPVAETAAVPVAAVPVAKPATKKAARSAAKSAVKGGE
jgi:hypothetical protein